MNEWLRENPRLAAEVAQATEVSRYLWERGWAEANGGNLSVNVSSLLETPPPPSTADTKLTRSYSALAGEVFLVTGTGCRFRDFAREPERFGCLLQLDARGEGYRIVWGGRNEAGFRPTSELPSHLTLHAILKARGVVPSVVLHTHATELVTLTHLREWKDEARLNAVLLGMMPEVKVLLPHGVGCVPYAVPGSEELATATGAALSRGVDLILWEMHGALAVGRGCMEVFDRLDTANKGARILLNCLAAHEVPAGLGPERLAELTRLFRLGA